MKLPRQFKKPKQVLPSKEQLLLPILYLASIYFFLDLKPLYLASIYFFLDLKPLYLASIYFFLDLKPKQPLPRKSLPRQMGKAMSFIFLPVNCCRNDPC